MKTKKCFPLCRAELFLLTSFTLTLFVANTSADWLKIDPPPDVDKYSHGHSEKNSCWCATAADMLAGAGYGDGDDVNERADDIYLEIFTDLNDCNQLGWVDTALNAWLKSNYNKWSNNPYKAVQFHGHRDPRPPWARTDLPMLIGNKLRDCEMLRISIRRPTCDTSTGTGGHALAAWGDDGDANDLNDNPDLIWVTDSDKGNMNVWEQSYSYDDYNNPNPNDTANCNEGNGWYIPYWNIPHWYIDGIVTLSAVDSNGLSQVQTLVVSTSTTYNGNDPCATDLHYKIVSDVNILSYATTISSPNDWTTNAQPDIVEDDKQIDVVWDLQFSPVPKGTTMVITASIVIAQDPNDDPGDNSVGIKNILWTPLFITPLPGALLFGHHMGMGGPAYYAPSMCGGYVICACDIYSDPDGSVKLGEHRFQLEYKYYQNPEHHELFFEPEPMTAFMGNFRFGHSYALLLEDELWAFDQWRQYEYITPPYPMMQPMPFSLTWEGQLPYPAGQDYIPPQKCGDPGTDYLLGDVNKDCRVDLKDMAEVALDWLGCTDPNDPKCF